MSFVRPELIAGTRRWRETLIGIGAAALGGLWATTGNGALTIIGMGLLVGGLLLAAAGIQRARFRRGGGGAGVVEVVEGQMAYFGPAEGGVVSVGEMIRLEVDPSPSGTGWIVTPAEGAPLRIPANAEGAEALFDVFAALPGLSTEALLIALETPPAGRQTLWQRNAPRLH